MRNRDHWLRNRDYWSRNRDHWHRLKNRVHPLKVENIDYQMRFLASRFFCFWLCCLVFAIFGSQYAKMAYRRNRNASDVVHQLLERVELDQSAFPPVGIARFGRGVSNTCTATTSSSTNSASTSTGAASLNALPMRRQSAFFIRNFAAPTECYTQC